MIDYVKFTKAESYVIFDGYMNGGYNIENCREETKRMLKKLLKTGIDEEEREIIEGYIKVLEVSYIEINETDIENMMRESIIYFNIDNHATSMYYKIKEDGNVIVVYFNSGLGVSKHPINKEMKVNEEGIPIRMAYIGKEISMIEFKKLLKKINLIYRENKNQNMLYDLIIGSIFLRREQYNLDRTEEEKNIYLEDYVDMNYCDYMVEQTIGNCTGRASINHLCTYIKMLGKREYMKKYERIIEKLRYDIIKRLIKNIENRINKDERKIDLKKNENVNDLLNILKIIKMEYGGSEIREYLEEKIDKIEKKVKGVYKYIKNDKTGIDIVYGYDDNIIFIESFEYNIEEISRYCKKIFELNNIFRSIRELKKLNNKLKEYIINREDKRYIYDDRISIYIDNELLSIYNTILINIDIYKNNGEIVKHLVNTLMLIGMLLIKVINQIERTNGDEKIEIKVEYHNIIMDEEDKEIMDMKYSEEFRVVRVNRMIVEQIRSSRSIYAGLAENIIFRLIISTYGTTPLINHITINRKSYMILLKYIILINEVLNKSEELGYKISPIYNFIRHLDEYIDDINNIINLEIEIPYDNNYREYGNNTAYIGYYELHNISKEEQKEKIVEKVKKILDKIICIRKNIIEEKYIENIVNYAEVYNKIYGKSEEIRRRIEKIREMIEREEEKLEEYEKKIRENNSMKKEDKIIMAYMESRISDYYFSELKKIIIGMSNKKYDLYRSLKRYIENEIDYNDIIEIDDKKMLWNRRDREYRLIGNNKICIIYKLMIYDYMDLMKYIIIKNNRNKEEINMIIQRKLNKKNYEGLLNKEYEYDEERKEIIIAEDNNRIIFTEDRMNMIYNDEILEEYDEIDYNINKYILNKIYSITKNRLTFRQIKDGIVNIYVFMTENSIYKEYFRIIIESDDIRLYYKEEEIELEDNILKRWEYGCPNIFILKNSRMMIINRVISIMGKDFWKMENNKYKFKEIGKYEVNYIDYDILGLKLIVNNRKVINMLIYTYIYNRNLNCLYNIIKYIDKNSEYYLDIMELLKEDYNIPLYKFYVNKINNIDIYNNKGNKFYNISYKRQVEIIEKTIDIAKYEMNKDKIKQKLISSISTTEVNKTEDIYFNIMLTHLKTNNKINYTVEEIEEITRKLLLYNNKDGSEKEYKINIENNRIELGRRMMEIIQIQGGSQIKRRIEEMIKRIENLYETYKYILPIDNKTIKLYLFIIKYENLRIELNEEEIENVEEEMKEIENTINEHIEKNRKIGEIDERIKYNSKNYIYNSSTIYEYKERLKAFDYYNLDIEEEQVDINYIYIYILKLNKLLNFLNIKNITKEEEEMMENKSYLMSNLYKYLNKIFIGMYFLLEYYPYIKILMINGKKNTKRSEFIKRIELIYDKQTTIDSMEITEGDIAVVAQEVEDTDPLDPLSYFSVAVRKMEVTDKMVEMLELTEEEEKEYIMYINCKLKTEIKLLINEIKNIKYFVDDYDYSEMESVLAKMKMMTKNNIEKKLIDRSILDIFDGYYGIFHIYENYISVIIKKIPNHKYNELYNIRIYNKFNKSEEREIIDLELLEEEREIIRKQNKKEINYISKYEILNESVKKYKENEEKEVIMIKSKEYYKNLIKNILVRMDRVIEKYEPINIENVFLILLKKDRRLLNQVINLKTYNLVIKLYEEKEEIEKVNMTTPSENNIRNIEIIEREIKKLLTNTIINTDDTLLKKLYELSFGFNMKEEQITLINRIINEISTNKMNMYQMLMGGGKTSVVIPYLNLYYVLLKEKTVINVLPESLVNQTYELFNNYIRDVFTVDIVLLKVERGEDIMKKKLNFYNTIYIMSDVSYKSLYLNMILDSVKYSTILEKIRESIILFDEVDMIGDTQTSELNYPVDEARIPENLGRDMEIIMDVIDILYITNKKIVEENINLISNNNYNEIIENSKMELNRYINKKLETEEDYEYIWNRTVRTEEIMSSIIREEIEILIKIFDKTVPLMLQLLHKKDFGFVDNEDDKAYNYIAIPYIAFETPAFNEEKKTNSDFNEYYLKIALTYISYKAKNGKITRIQKDRYYRYITDLYRSELLLFNIYDREIKTENKKLIDIMNELVNEKGEIIRKVGDRIEEEKYDRIIKEICKYNVLKNIKINTEYYNINFVDIISKNVSNYNIGFTGTPFLYVPYIYNQTTNEINKEFEIIPSLLDTGKTISGLTNSFTSVSVFNKNNLERILVNYDVLIDVGALFIDKSSYENIKIFKRMIRNKRYYIYIDNNHKKKYITNDSDEPRIFNEGIDINGRFIFYDQGHITGQDFKLLPTAQGIITIKENSTFRDVAQGGFRLRNLNNGQRVDYMMDNVSEINFKEKNMVCFYRIIDNLYKNNKIEMKKKKKLGIKHNMMRYIKENITTEYLVKEEEEKEEEKVNKIYKKREDEYMRYMYRKYREINIEINSMSINIQLNTEISEEIAMAERREIVFEGTGNRNIKNIFYASDIDNLRLDYPIVYLLYARVIDTRKQNKEFIGAIELIVRSITVLYRDYENIKAHNNNGEEQYIIFNENYEILKDELMNEQIKKQLKIDYIIYKLYYKKYIKISEVFELIKNVMSDEIIAERYIQKTTGINISVLINEYINKYRDKRYVILMKYIAYYIAYFRTYEEYYNFILGTVNYLMTFDRRINIMTNMNYKLLSKMIVSELIGVDIEKYDREELTNEIYCNLDKLNKLLKYMNSNLEKYIEYTRKENIKCEITSYVYKLTHTQLRLERREIRSEIIRKYITDNTI